MTKYIDVEYKKFCSLKEAYDDIQLVVDSSLHNFCYKFEISISDLKKDDSFPAEADDAELWLKEKPPVDFFFNHGEHIHKFKGFEHVQNELRIKPSSKRALFTLISQEEISNSGDYPIPSFLVAQYGKSEQELYTTHYYRALEIHTFLKINLNEIKKIVCRLEDNVDCCVRVTIFSFYAYKDPDFFPLKKFRINVLEQVELLAALKNGKCELASFFDEMKKNVSYIEFKGVDNIIKIVDHVNKDKKIGTGASDFLGIELDPAVMDPIFLENIKKLKNSLEIISMLQAKGASKNTIAAQKKEHDDLLDAIIKHINIPIS